MEGGTSTLEKPAHLAATSVVPSPVEDRQIVRG